MVSDRTPAGGPLEGYGRQSSQSRAICTVLRAHVGLLRRWLAGSAGGVVEGQDWKFTAEAVIGVTVSTKSRPLTLVPRAAVGVIVMRNVVDAPGGSMTGWKVAVGSMLCRQ